MSNFSYWKKIYINCLAHIYILAFRYEYNHSEIFITSVLNSDWQE